MAFDVGATEEITDKILRFRDIYGLTRIIFQIEPGNTPHKEFLSEIIRNSRRAQRCLSRFRSVLSRSTDCRKEGT